MFRRKAVPSWASYIPDKLEGLSEEQLRWIYLIILRLRVADVKRIRSVFFFTQGFLGEPKPVSESDTTN